MYLGIQESQTYRLIFRKKWLLGGQYKIRQNVMEFFQKNGVLTEILMPSPSIGPK